METTAKIYYVSPNGNDASAGTKEAPFATIERARDAIRELASGDGLPDGGITVYLRGGEYKMKETLVFDETDSGTEKCPIKYASFEGERAYIDGGYTLDPSKFVTPSEEILARMQSEEAKAHLKEYDLATEGVDYSENLVRGNHKAITADCRLFVGGTRCWLGRYPNNTREIAYEYIGDCEEKTFVDKTGRVKNWAPESFETARMYGNFEIDWMASSGVVKSYDPETNKVTYEGGNCNGGGRYFYYNVLEEVDVPYEYFIDQKTGKLYLYLTEEMIDKKISFTQLRGSLVDAKVSYYTFENITFENAMDQIIIIRGNYNTFRGCEIRCSGRHGIRLYGDHVTFDSNDVYSIGACGLTIRGGDPANLICGDNIVTNNRMHDFGELDRVYNGAISVERGIGYTISHNEIYYGPHLCIGYDGKDVIMEYNYIHDVCYEAGDAGAVYVYGGSWKENGMIFRNNLVENINCKMALYYNPTAVYIDASTGGVQVYSNVLKNIDGWGVMVRGMDNVIRDNLLIDASISMDCAAFYKLPGLPNCGWSGDENGPISIFPVGMLWNTMLDPEKTPEYASKAWEYRYPWTMLVKTTNVYDLQDPFVAYAFGDMQIRQNAIYPPKRKMYVCPEPDPKLLIVRDNIYFDKCEELGLVDVEGGDYTVKEDSKIYSRIPGFKPCDFANVGLVGR